MIASLIVVFFPFLLGRLKLRAIVHEDRISKLPSDILISIISRLPIREATSTCVLSTRWRDLHTYNTHLNFPKYEFGFGIKSYNVNMVNHVLNSHRGGQIKEFRLEILEHDVFETEWWFKFALAKKAEIIHIYLPGMMVHGFPHTNGLKCLKELSLINIQMTDQDFKLLVSNSLALECLTVKYSNLLENVSIIGLSKLKHLNLSFIWRVRSIVIRDAISLVSLTCCVWRSDCNVQLSNIPKLTKLDFRECRNGLTQVEFLSRMSSSTRDQLQILRLSSWNDSMQLNLDLLNDMSLQLKNIKHLEFVLDWSIDPNWNYVSHYACRLVEACGSLEKLVIEFLHTLKMDLEEFNAVTYDHPKCDLSLEILGYSGYPRERELALYIINNATSLQKLILRKSIWDIRLFRGNKNWLASIMLDLLKIEQRGLLNALAGVDYL